MMFVSTACQFSTSIGKPEATLPPTTSPFDRKIPTRTVQPTEQITPGELRLSRGTYFHPSGTFSFVPPAGWAEDTSEYGYVTFAEPDGEGFINTTVTYTGYTLLPEDFERFFLAREANFFTGYDNYLAVDQQTDLATGTAWARKTVDYEGIGNTVDSYYFLSDLSVYVIDLWSETARVEQYETLYQQMMDSFQMSLGDLQTFPLYNFVWTLRDPLGAFSFEIPISWRYEYLEQSGAIVDESWAPDNDAFITHIHLIGEGNLEKKAQIKRVEEVLQSIYPDLMENVKVINQQDWDPDGILLEWSTSAKQWRLQTLIRSTGEDLMALSGFYMKDYEDSYLSTIDYGFDWYSVPAADE